jgi:Asp-tRNA(Asn)/Glu-tRNA(Gln) amidotransferase A subunit family amidase
MSLPELSAVELRRLIGARQVSPVELMDACIERIDALNPAINAICATDFERARAGAKHAESCTLSTASVTTPLSSEIKVTSPDNTT